MAEQRIYDTKNARTFIDGKLAKLTFDEATQLLIKGFELDFVDATDKDIDVPHGYFGIWFGVKLIRPIDTIILVFEHYGHDDDLMCFAIAEDLQKDVASRLALYMETSDDIGKSNHIYVEIPSADCTKQEDLDLRKAILDLVGGEA